ncbi:MAG: hypothetical protein JW936_08540 [Sedimentisphaerales bacterium]|nr:hypothetical protein [Sedimentisphaerales bacterium]
MAKKKKATKKAVKAKKSANKEVLVVASKVKAYVKSKGCMCSSEIIQAASDMLYCALDKAMARADANRRRTVKGQDL